MVQFSMPAPEELLSTARRTEESESSPGATVAATTEASTAPPVSSSAAATIALGDCLKCHKQKIAYETDPCGCPSFCTDCARKLASGGRCKVCREFYGGLQRIRL